MGYVEHNGPQVRPGGCGRRGVVVRAFMLGAVLEPGMLPARSIAPALANQLQVAIEALKATRAKCRRNLPLQSSLRVVLFATARLRHGTETAAVVFGLPFVRVRGGRRAHRSPHHGWASRCALRLCWRRHVGTAATCGEEKKHRGRRNEPACRDARNSGPLCDR